MFTSVYPDIMIKRASVLDRLSALADQTRSRILLLLDRHELTVGELCTVLQLPQSTVSRHLRILSDEGWIASRGEATSRYYSMVARQLDPSARRLWQVVRGEIDQASGTAQDLRRLETVLAQRRSRSQQFFSTAAGVWDQLRAEMIGQRSDLLALLDLLDEDMIVGDLGCGTGHLTAALAPCVRRVIAVDDSRAMLATARERLAGGDNVEFRVGGLESLPIDDNDLDAAIVFLVATFLPDPLAAVREAHRVLRPGGKLLLVDLTPHDRAEYALQLGHVWQGFEDGQVRDWFVAAGFESPRVRALPADPLASGPALFAATGRKSRGLAPRSLQTEVPGEGQSDGIP